MELKLIEITWNTNEGAVDYTIPSAQDDIVKENKEEVAQMLEFLANALRNKSYPFSNLN